MAARIVRDARGEHLRRTFLWGTAQPLQVGVWLLRVGLRLVRPSEDRSWGAVSARGRGVAFENRQKTYEVFFRVSRLRRETLKCGREVVGRENAALEWTEAQRASS